MKPDVVEEFTMRLKRFTVTYLPRWDRIVMTTWTGEAASYTFDEFEHAVRLMQAKRRKEAPGE